MTPVEREADIWAWLCGFLLPPVALMLAAYLIIAIQFQCPLCAGTANASASECGHLVQTTHAQVVRLGE